MERPPTRLASPEAEAAPAPSPTPRSRGRSRAARIPLAFTLAALALLALIGPSATLARPTATHSATTHSAPTRRAPGLRAPRLQGPGAGVSLQSLPTFTWQAVPGASAYQFQLSADRHFGSIVETQIGKGSLETPNTAATLAKTVPNGTYYWRVRAVSGKNSAGPWSGARRMVKAWTYAPTLLGPSATTVRWPAQPLVFSWSPVPYAVKYQLTVGTDAGLANQVIGNAKSPLITQATVYTPSTPLTPGTYFWRVTPIDAQGHQGRSSETSFFQYEWPTSTTTSVSDLNPDPRVFEPLFNWAPIPGAARYEVEVNSAEGFPAGSKWCCSTTTIGTSFAPTSVLANNRYYWRVRAIDAHGSAGQWNEGASFTKAFDGVEPEPTVPGLTVRDTSGNALAGVPSVSTPIVTWNPVPGASVYQVQIAPYVGGSGCDWAVVGSDKSAYEAETATTGWTPLARLLTKIGPKAWPTPQSQPPLPPGEYCARVLARTDNDAQGGQVISDWTQVNGADNAAFDYTGAPSVGTSTAPETPASAYLEPASGTLTPRTPLLTWQPVEGAHGYYVVISRDAGFTEVADVGYTNVTAYAPRVGAIGADESPLSDETTSYYWAVIPSTGSEGQGVFHDLPQENSPQSFDKSSVPPAPQSPAPGEVVGGEPTFRWGAAENARSYTLQVSQDPSFGNPIDNVTTDSTAYTSTSTYPAHAVLYWRVRANDWIKQGLNWSPVQSFVRTLPSPTLSPGNPTGGEPIPVLDWSTVPGAIGYEVHIDKVNGTLQNVSVLAAAMTPVEWYGVGVWRWQVRAEFPGASAIQPITSEFSASQTFTRTLDAPSGAHGVKSGARLVVSWNPDPAAKEYSVGLSSTDGFATSLASTRTDNTSWAPHVVLTAAQARKALYWRVAAVDSGGNTGSYVIGRLNPPKPTTCRVKGRRVRCATKKKPHKKKHG